MSDFLTSIVEKKRMRVASLKSERSMGKVREEAYRQRDGAQAHALRNALGDDQAINIIAEIKKASPSKGELCSGDIRAAEVAVAYELAGAVAVSVLTEEDYFRGSLDDLVQVRDAVSLPILRKDFVIDEYQIYEAAAAGADAVLLIAALLDESQLARLRTIAEDELRLDSLLEVHDEKELGQARSAGATLIGVNNRNLHTFEISLDVSVKLMGLAPREALVISESGLSSGEQLKSLRAIGYRGFLIGEKFMRSKDPEVSLRTMIHEARH
jgi:indole-3-glycerol phosphate synthase